MFEGVIGKPGDGDILLDDLKVIPDSDCNGASDDVVSWYAGYYFNDFKYKKMPNKIWDN